jgi:hypothetical protein
MLVEHDEIIEEPHRRTQRREGRLFVGRHAGRAVEMIHSQDAALLLRKGRLGPRQAISNTPAAITARKFGFISLFLPCSSCNSPLDGISSGPFSGLSWRVPRLDRIARVEWGDTGLAPLLTARLCLITLADAEECVRRCYDDATLMLPIALRDRRPMQESNLPEVA